MYNLQEEMNIMQMGNEEVREVRMWESDFQCYVS